MKLTVAGERSRDITFSKLLQTFLVQSSLGYKCYISNMGVRKTTNKTHRFTVSIISEEAMEAHISSNLQRPPDHVEQV